MIKALLITCLVLSVSTLLFGHLSYSYHSELAVTLGLLQQEKANNKAILEQMDKLEHQQELQENAVAEYMNDILKENASLQDKLDALNKIKLKQQQCKQVGESDENKNNNVASLDSVLDADVTGLLLAE